MTSQLLDAMRSLNRRGAQWVVTTQGDRPVWVTSASSVYRLHCLPADKVVNPLGSGDAMAAAIAWAIRDGRSIVEAVRLGIAAAAENLRRLETGRLDPAVVQRLAGEVRVDCLSQQIRLPGGILACISFPAALRGNESSARQAEPTLAQSAGLLVVTQRNGEPASS